MDERLHVIIHPSDMAQSDWVRCIYPFMQFMSLHAEPVIPSITHIPCSNKETLKKVRSIIFQKPLSPARANIVAGYSKIKKEYGFKLITDMDDLIWELSPVILSYTKDSEKTNENTAKVLEKVLPLFDTVVCSTKYLADKFKIRFGARTKVLPNAVSSALFGKERRQVPFNHKPRVMYAGNLGHSNTGILGDFEGPWVPWIRSLIEKDAIDFYVFGNPDFLAGLEGKYTTIPYTDFLQFPSVARSYQPDFYLAPLCDNNFNRAKSDLKLKEAAALGAVFIGSNFPDSPYAAAPKAQLLQPTDTADDLAAKFEYLCNPAHYMEAIQWQYAFMDENHWWYEDPVYRQKFLETYLYP
jgi:hypothetical protein